MADSSKINRRTLMAALPLSAGMMASRSAAGAEDRWDFDLENPDDLLKAYTKVAGSLDKREVYIQYYGEIVAILPHTEQVPLFRLKGIARSRWEPNSDGSSSYTNYDHGLFCDFETGEVLKQYENPLTGEMNDPLHYRSGPLTATVGRAEGQFDPSELDWRQVGDQISVTSTRVGLSFKNPVDPETWPKASTGERVFYSATSTYFADAAEVADPSRSSIPADHVWTFITNYPAWMKMGDASGNVLWRWTARKVVDASELDPYIESEIEKRAPGFMTADKPWPERLDGWTQYSLERKPKP